MSSYFSLAQGKTEEVIRRCFFVHLLDAIDGLINNKRLNLVFNVRRYFPKASAADINGKPSRHRLALCQRYRYAYASDTIRERHRYTHRTAAIPLDVYRTAPVDVNAPRGLPSNGLSPSAPTVSPSVVPRARRTAVAPCRGSWTTASSTAAITLAATRLASLPRPIGPSALQFNQLLQLPIHKKAHLAGSLLL